MHTKGPWDYIYDGVTQSWEIDQGYPNGINARIRIYKAPNQSIDEQGYNAALIAAAPELLEALEATIIPLQRLGDFIGNIDNGGVSGLGSFNRCDILLAVRSAIAKARGL